MSTGKTMLGVLAGFAAGALVGVLLAPEKGSETRKKIAKKGEDYAGDLTDKFNELRDTINEKLGNLEEKGMKIVEQGKSKIDELKNHAKSAVSTAAGSQHGTSSQDKWSNPSS